MDESNGLQHMEGQPTCARHCHVKLPLQHQTDVQDVLLDTSIPVCQSAAKVLEHFLQQALMTFRVVGVDDSGPLHMLFLSAQSAIEA